MRLAMSALFSRKPPSSRTVPPAVREAPSPAVAPSSAALSPPASLPNHSASPHIPASSSSPAAPSSVTSPLPSPSPVPSSLPPAVSSPPASSPHVGSLPSTASPPAFVSEQDKMQAVEDAKTLQRRPSLARRMSDTMRRRLSGSKSTAGSGRILAVVNGEEERSGMEMEMWGRNDSLQLVVGRRDDEAEECAGEDVLLENGTPKPVTLEESVTAVAIGDFHSIANSLLRGGSIWGAGENDDGQLDPNQTPNAFQIHAARQIASLPVDKRVVSVAVGAKHCAVVTEDGLVLTWGANDLGQLGHSKDVFSKVPPRLLDGTIRKERSVQVTCTEGATLILTERGQVWSTGEAARGALGRPETLDSGCSWLASPIRGKLCCNPIRFLATGAAHVVAVSVTGRAFGWGLNRHKQLGFVSLDRFESSPVALSLPDECDFVTHASCGVAHTCIVSKNGKAFTAGAGDQGQLGRIADVVGIEGGMEWGEVILPHLVIVVDNDHDENHVVQSACGSYHTLLSTDHGHVFGFGSNEFGEIFAVTNNDSEASNKIVPLPMVLPLLRYVAVLAAGGRASSVLKCPTSEALFGYTRTQNSKRREGGLTTIILLSLARETINNGSLGGLMGALTSEFQASGLNRSFFSTGSASGVDVMAMRAAMLEVWRAMTAKDETKGKRFLFDRFEKLHAELIDIAPAATEPDQLRAFFIALLNPLAELMPSATYITLVRAVAALNDEALNTIVRWSVLDCNGETFKLGLLKPMLRVLDFSIAARDWYRGCAQPAVRVLDRLHKATQNKQPSFVLFSDFYTQQPSRWSASETVDEFTRFLESKRISAQIASGKKLKSSTTPSFNLFDYPFLISAEAKRNVVQYRSQESQIQSWALMTVSRTGTPFFELSIRREHVLEDAMGVLLRAKNKDLSKPLKVAFTDEYGLDWGGVRKEFFELLSGELFAPDKQDFLIRLDADSPNLWFNARGKSTEFIRRVEERKNKRSNEISDEDKKYVQIAADCSNCPQRCGLLPFIADHDTYHCDVCGVRLELAARTFSCRKCDYDVCLACKESDVPEESEAYRRLVLAGTLMGLAVYNGTLLDVRFPSAFYWGLLGKLNAHPMLEDLEEIDPALALGLKKMIEYPAEDPEGFDTVFGYQTFYLEDLKHELIPGGENINVTLTNRESYAQKRCEFELYAGVAPLQRALLFGFSSVVDVKSEAMKLFSAPELELMIVGVPDLDFGALKNNTQYEGGFSEKTLVVQWFWELLEKEFSPDQQRAFLRFATGSSHAPIGGLGNQKLVIQRAGPDSNQLPTAHTCFNTLLVPEYPDMIKTREKFRISLLNNEGFGLQ